MRILPILVIGIACMATVAEARSQERTTVIVQAPPPSSSQPDTSHGNMPRPVPNTPARISSGIEAKRRLTGIDPVYPDKARANGIEGTVTLHVIVGKDGHVNTLEWVAGPKELTTAATDAVRQWTYKPFLLNGEPHEVDTTVIVNFSLNHSGN